MNTFNLKTFLTDKRFSAMAVLIVAIAAYLRLSDLGRLPLWVDEAFFYFLSKEKFPYQEFIPCLFAKILGYVVPLEQEFWLRLPFALCGIGLVAILVFHKKDRKASLVLAFIVAACPLFVFWSKMARPYMIGAFFVALGWRWPIFYIPALLTTPIALTGINYIKTFGTIWHGGKNLFYALGSVLTVSVLAVGSFLLRPDTGKDWNLGFVLHAKRIWIIPFTALCFYLLEYIFPLFKHSAAKKYKQSPRLER